MHGSKQNRKSLKPVSPVMFEASISPQNYGKASQQALGDLRSSKYAKCFSQTSKLNRTRIEWLLYAHFAVVPNYY